jgi:O-antigen/teichoic acid export membrane protein
MKTIEFFRSAKTVLLGMAVAQLIPLLASLIIARVYAPAEFGLFSAWLGLVSMAAVLVTGRFEMALAVEPDGAPRRFAMQATLFTILAVCGIFCVIAIGVFQLWPALFRGLTSGLVWMFIPATLLVSVVQTWQSWAAAEGAYRYLSWIRIVQALGVTAIQITAGYFQPDAFGLASGYVLGVLIGVCVAVFLMPVEAPSLQNLSGFVIKVKVFWRRHHRFPLFALPADGINAAAAQLPLFLIANKYGLESSGIFALTVRVLGAPVGFLGAAVLDVFKRSAAVSYREHGHCRDDYDRTFRILAGCGVVLALSVMLVAEPLFVLAFGETWGKAGIIAIWLMPMFVMRFVASPLSYVFYIAGKQKIDLMWQIALLTMTLTVFLVPDDFESSIKAYAAGYALLYISYLVLSYQYSKGTSA